MTEGHAARNQDVPFIGPGAGVQRRVLSCSAEDESVMLNPGDFIVVPPDLLRGTTCLEKRALPGIFTPMRRDFL